MLTVTEQLWLRW